MGKGGGAKPMSKTKQTTGKNERKAKKGVVKSKRERGEERGGELNLFPSDFSQL